MNRLSWTALILKLTTYLVLTAVLTSCLPKRYDDRSNLYGTELLTVPQGEYESVAWFNENVIALIYRPAKPDSDGLNTDFRIITFDLSNNNAITLPSITNDSCSLASAISDITTLPNASFGFVFRCHVKNGGLSGTLYIWDQSQAEYHIWKEYPGFLVRNFSFSPDMSKVVQENGVGGGLNNELYLVDDQELFTRLVPEFKRARSPTWSYDGKSIAFAGTRLDDENKDLQDWHDIESLAYYPWDIYLMDSDGGNARILLPAVGNIYDLKWSPVNPSLLLFGGTAFDDSDGIWLLDIATDAVTRVWKKNTRFDWSPDGTRIVLLDGKSNFSMSEVIVLELHEP